MLSFAVRSCSARTASSAWTVRRSVTSRTSARTKRPGMSRATNDESVRIVNGGAGPLRLVCCLPVGGQGRYGDGAPFTPPWAE